MGFVSSRLVESFHMTNDITERSIFHKTAESEIKMMKKMCFLVGDGLDTGSKEDVRRSDVVRIFIC